MVEEPQFQVVRDEAVKFSQIWKHNGVVVPLQDVHIDFARDFANVVLMSFVGLCKQKAQAALQDRQDALVTTGQ